MSLDAPWLGPKHGTIPINALPLRSTIRVWIPPPILEDTKILSLLQRQNSEANPGDWRIVSGRAKDKGNGKDLWISVNTESVQYLRSKEGTLRFGLGTVRAKILDRDGDTKQVEGGAD